MFSPLRWHPQRSGSWRKVFILIEMAAPKPADELDLQSYYERRTQELSQRLLDLVADLSSKESLQRNREFEDHVERRLQNGAKVRSTKKTVPLTFSTSTSCEFHR